MEREPPQDAGGGAQILLGPMSKDLGGARAEAHVRAWGIMLAVLEKSAGCGSDPWIAEGGVGLLAGPV